MSFFWGGGLMHVIKIPQQDFVLKTQRGGGLMREGGGAYLQDTTIYLVFQSVSLSL